MSKKIMQLGLALSVFVSRLGFLPPNFSPVGSYGFFGGNLWLFGLVTIGFDYYYGGFYQGVIFTYAGFLAYFLLGKLAKKSWRRQMMLLPAASLLFFLISNLGVWWYWYDHTWSDLGLCFLLALPFYRNTFLADMIFGYGWLAGRVLLKSHFFQNMLAKQVSIAGDEQ